MIPEELWQQVTLLIERLSKITMIGKETTKKAQEVSNEVMSLFKPIQSYLLTITSDNGIAFSVTFR